MTLKDVDKLKEFISDTWILDRIDELPSIDAMEVVRCKDCKHFPVGREEEEEYGWVTWPRDEYGFIDKVCPYYCEDNYYSQMPPKNGFCHEGEKKR